MKTIKVTLAESDGGDGIGRHDDIPDSEFDPKQLELGIKVEMEHSDDYDVAKSIAKDHLRELPDYYTRLLKMEGEREGETAMTDVLNPLYVKSPRPNGDGKTVANADAKMKETSAFSNTQEGICPKCNCQMETANLGQSMGNQRVHYCNSCRVAEPIKNI